MSFNISKIKAALTEAGHVVTEGAELAHKDMLELYDWAYLHLGLSKKQVQYGLAYPSTITKDFPGHPQAETTAGAQVAGPKVEAPAAAPVTPVPAVEASTITDSAPVAEPVVTEVVAPAVEQTPVIETVAEPTPEAVTEVAAPATESIPVVEQSTQTIEPEVTPQP